MSFGEMDVLARPIQLRRLCSCCRDGGDGRTSEHGKQTTLKFLADSFDKCAKDIAATTPDPFEKMFDISWWVFTDIAHHRGQAEVYLRVKNITPPHYRFEGLKRRLNETRRI